MATFHRSIHWVLGALTYYIVWPVYYIYQILSAAWLVYRLGRTTTKHTRHSSSRGAHRLYRDNLDSHLQDLEKQNEKGWVHEQRNWQDEIRHPITVVAVGWKEEKKDLHAKPAERLSVLMQHYTDSSRECRYSKGLSMADVRENPMAQKSGPPNFSKKFPISNYG